MDNNVFLVADTFFLKIRLQTLNMADSAQKLHNKQEKYTTERRFSQPKSEDRVTHTVASI